MIKIALTGDSAIIKTKLRKGEQMKNSLKLFTYALLMLIAVNVSLKTNEGNAQWNAAYGLGTLIKIQTFASSGSYLYAGTNDAGVYVSTNNGTNWTQTSLNNMNVTGFAVLGSNVFAGGYTVAPPNVGRIYVTSNNGVNWTQTSYPESYTQVLSMGANSNTLFAGTQNNGVIKSTNNGLNWVATALNGRRVFSISTNGNNIYAGVRIYGLYYSTDNGTTWTENRLLDSFSVYTYSVTSSGSNVFAGAEMPHGVLRSTNNGVNWVRSGLQGSRNINALVSVGNNIFAGTSDSGVFYSSNNGANWVKKNQGFPPGFSLNVEDLYIANNYIFLGSPTMSFWRRLYSEILIGINNISTETPSDYSLNQNYPNPFNPSTKISFSVPKSGLVTMKVYDLLGKEIAEIVNQSMQPGTYEATWDASRFTSGVYFYKLEANGFSDMKKMMLIK